MNEALSEDLRISDLIRRLEAHRERYGDALMHAETETMVCPVVDTRHDVFDAAEGNVCLLVLDLADGLE
jgi:hypothetical protein